MIPKVAAVNIHQSPTSHHTLNLLLSLGKVRYVLFVPLKEHSETQLAIRVLYLALGVLLSRG